MALAIKTEQSDFVDEGDGPSYGCENAQAMRLRSFSVTPCSSADTA